MAGAIMIHFAIWYVISNYQWGAHYYFQKIIEKWPKYKKNLPGHYEGKADTKLCGLTKDPARVYAMWVKTMIHHGTGGALMTAGIYFNIPFLWRHGMCTEVGGLDVVDMLGLAKASFFPPGNAPFAAYVKNPSIVFILVSHHLVGLSIGVPLCIYYSANYQIQYFGLIILGGPCPFILMEILIKYNFNKKFKKLLFFVSLIVACGWTYQRAIFYFPEVYSILNFVYTDSIPIIPKVLICFGAVMMSFFNCIMIPLTIKAVYDEF